MGVARASGGEHEAWSAPSSGARRASVASRSEEPTIPSSPRPDAPVAQSPRREERESCPEWCVDRGDQLAPMSTFELWVALATGRVRADARVWREGMEGWTPARDVAELAAAMPEGEIAAAAELADLVSGLGPETLRPLDLAEVDAATPAPDPQQTALRDPEPSEPPRASKLDLVVAHPKLAVRLARVRAARFLRNTVTPITIGSAVAAASVSLAVAWVTAHPAPASVAAVATAHVRVETAAAMASLPAAAPETTPANPRLADATARHELGQRRLRAGRHR